MSGSASAWRNATVAPAIQATARPIVAAAADTGPKASAAMAARAASANEEIGGADAAEFDQAIVANEVVHRRRVDIDAGDRVAGELLARDGYRQRAALRPRAFGGGREALRRDLAVFDVQHRADQHDLAAEMALEEILVVFRRAGVQIGERIRRDVVGAAFES